MYMTQYNYTCTQLLKLSMLIVRKFYGHVAYHKSYYMYVLYVIVHCTCTHVLIYM